MGDSGGTEVDMTDYDNNAYGPAPQGGGQFQQPGSYCKYCGTFIKSGSAYCPACGRPQGNIPQQHVMRPVMNQPQQYPHQQPGYPYQANAYGYQQHPQTVVNVVGSRSNGLGTAGFVLALLSVLFCWAPFVNLIIWFLGLLFSFIGVFKSPRGLAIAGLVISLIDIIVVIIFFGALLGLASANY